MKNEKSTTIKVGIIRGKDIYFSCRKKCVKPSRIHKDKKNDYNRQKLNKIEDGVDEG